MTEEGLDPPVPDSAAVTRWEERLRVGTETVVTGRVRLRKRVVDDEQTITVPIAREEIRIDYEEVPDADRAPATDDRLADEVHEVIRYEEQIVVTKVIVPVERVRLIREVRTTDHRVAGDVRRERVDVEVDDTDPR